MDIQEKQDVVIEKKKNKIGLIIGILVAIVAVAAIVATIIVVANGPTSKAKKALDLGKRYFDDMEYEKALAEFAEALEIDPNNEEIKAAVEDYISELVDMGYDYLDDGDYEEALNIANAILEYFPDNKEAKKLLNDIEDKEESDSEVDENDESDSSAETKDDEEADESGEVLASEPVGEAPVIYYNYYLYEGGFALEDFVDMTYEEFEEEGNPFLFFIWGEDAEDGVINYLSYNYTELPCSHPEEMDVEWATYKDYEVTYTITDSDNNSTSATLLLHYDKAPEVEGEGWTAGGYHSIKLEEVLDGNAYLYDEY